MFYGFSLFQKKRAQINNTSRNNTKKRAQDESTDNPLEKPFQTLISKGFKGNFG